MQTLRDRVTEKMKIIFENILNYDGDYIFSFNEYRLLVPNELENLQNDFIISNFINVRDNNKVEFLIKNEGLVRFRELKFEDSKYSFRVCDMTNQLLIKLFLSLPDKKVRLVVPISHIIYYNKNIYDFIKSTLFRHYYSLTIENKTDNNINNFEELAKSGLFNIAMSCGLNFCLITSLEHDEEKIKVSNCFERSLPNVPHRIYNDDLVQYYMAANSARIPKIQYLSYYNVLEFWFDKVYYDEKCQEIQEIITNPKFNCAHLKSYKKIIELFKSNKAQTSELDMLLSLFTSI